MRLWRLTRAPFVALDGQGALHHGGRYSPVGKPVVPLASEPGLAVLIALRYLPAERRDWADDHVLGWTEVAADPVSLADDGSDATVRNAVEAWLDAGQSLLARVASRVLPEADVVLLNVRHAQAHLVPALTIRPFDFAACLHVPPMLDTFRSKA